VRNFRKLVLNIKWLKQANYPLYIIDFPFSILHYQKAFLPTKTCDKMKINVCKVKINSGLFVYS